jgi:hypothetical protein
MEAMVSIVAHRMVVQAVEAVEVFRAHQTPLKVTTLIVGGTHIQQLPQISVAYPICTWQVNVQVLHVLRDIVLVSRELVFGLTMGVAQHLTLWVQMVVRVLVAHTKVLMIVMDMVVAPE